MGCGVTTRDQQARLIKPEQVDDVFCSAAIKDLAKVAKIPSSADLGKFGQSIRDAVRQYLVDSTAIRPIELRDSIAALAKVLRKAFDGEPDSLLSAANALVSLQPSTRRFLEERAEPSRTVPTVSDLLDPEKGRAALSLLYGLCHQGARWKPGRKRPGGKRSATTLQSYVASPKVQRGRPLNDAEFMLCTWLAVTYFKVTGERPPRFANHRAPGPFVRLLGGALRLARAPGVDPVELVNARGKYPPPIPVNEFPLKDPPADDA